MFSRGLHFTGEILVLWINGCNLQCVQEVVDKCRNLTASLVNNLVFPVMLRNGHGLALGGKGRDSDLYRFSSVMLRIIDFLL